MTKYVVDPPFSRMDLGFMVNLDKFNALPKNLQDVLTQTAAEFEKYAEQQFIIQAEKEREIFIKAGAEYVMLPKEEQAYYLKGFDEASWEELKATLPPTSYDELRKALIKKP